MPFAGLESNERSAARRPFAEQPLVLHRSFVNGGTDADPDTASIAHRRIRGWLDGHDGHLAPVQVALLHRHRRQRQDVALAANVGQPHQQAHRRSARKRKCHHHALRPARHPASRFPANHWRRHRCCAESFSRRQRTPFARPSRIPAPPSTAGARHRSRLSSISFQGAPWWNSNRRSSVPPRAPPAVRDAQASIIGEKAGFRQAFRCWVRQQPGMSELAAVMGGHQRSGGGT